MADGVIYVSNPEPIPPLVSAIQKVLEHQERELMQAIAIANLGQF